jgi:peptide/nickel transport system ATP-binding protein
MNIASSSTPPRPVLDIDSFSLEIHSAGRVHPILHDVNLQVMPGRIHALVGESGGGKSMVTRAITGLLPAGARITRGHLRIDGQETAAWQEQDWQLARGRMFSMVLQDPMTALNPMMRIGTQIAEVLRLQRGMEARQAWYEAGQLLDRVRVRDSARVLQLFPHQLSGGMRQRVVIAIAWACQPRLILCDEPTTALDVTVQKEVLRLISSLSQAGSGILLVTHDLGVVAKVAHSMSVIERGRILECGDVASVYASPAHAYTRALMAATPRFDRPEALSSPGGVPSIGHNIQPVASMPPPGPSNPLLRVQNLSLSVPDARAQGGPTPGCRPLLQDISLEMHAGQALGVIGESGSGKSTLARALTALMPIQEGQVWFEGRQVLGRPESQGGRHQRASLMALHGQELVEYRSRLQLVFQDPMSSLNPRLPVGTSIARPAQVLGRMRGQCERDLVAALLERVGLDPALAVRYPHELSGGQRQRVNIARALAVQPRALIADEVTSGLDVSAQARIVQLLRTLCREQGLALIFISHDLSLVRSLCDHILILQAGKVVESAPSNTLFAAPREAYTRRLLSAIPLPEPDLTWLDQTPEDMGVSA